MYLLFIKNNKELKYLTIKPNIFEIVLIDYLSLS